MRVKDAVVLREIVTAKLELIGAARCVLRAAAHVLTAASLRVVDGWEEATQSVVLGEFDGVNAPGGDA